MIRVVFVLIIILCFFFSLFLVGCGVEEEPEEGVEPVPEVEEKKAEPDLDVDQQDAEKEPEVKTQ